VCKGLASTPSTSGQIYNGANVEKMISKRQLTISIQRRNIIVNLFLSGGVVPKPPDRTAATPPPPPNRRRRQTAANTTTSTTTTITTTTTSTTTTMMNTSIQDSGCRTGRVQKLFSMLFIVFPTLLILFCRLRPRLRFRLRGSGPIIDSLSRSWFWFQSGLRQWL